MNLILAKTKMCADKAGLALRLGFERVAHTSSGKTIFTAPTTLEFERAKADATPRPIKKPLPQPTKKKPTPQPKTAPQPKMRESVRVPRVTGSRVPERCYHCTYCQREGHLVGFFFRHRKDERHEWDWSTWDM